MKSSKLLVAGLVFLPILCVSIILFGAKYSRALDFFSFWLHRMVNVPVKTHKIALTPSPDGAWRLEGIVHEWSQHFDGDTNTCEIVARHNEKPFQGGFNIAQRNWAKLLVNSRLEWVSNSVLAFHAKYEPAQTTVTLTVINATDRKLPYVSILASPYYMIFDMAPHSRRELICHPPREIINWIVGNEELSCSKQVLPPAPNKPLRGITMTIHDQNPSIVFDEREGVTGAANSTHERPKIN